MKHETVMPIYGIPIFMTDKNKQLNKRVRKKVPDYSNPKHVYGRCVAVDGDEGELLIGVFATGYSTLAHEAVHAANEVFKKIGQQLDPDNDECYAYLVEWIVKEFLDNIDL